MSKIFARTSKFRHVFGFPAKKDLCYEGFRVARTAHEPSLCAINLWFAAVAIESSGGGTFIVIPLKKKGRVATDHPRVRGHSAPITDLKWNPFDPSIIASSSEDCTVKLWRLPFEGLHLDLNRCLVDLRAHSKRVTHIEWHPTARDILLSASTDLQCILWNTASASVVRSINLHPDVILSISWNRTGSLFASTCRDRRIRVIDPRQGTVVAEGEGHEGSKASRVIFLSNRNWIFSTGFSRGSQRQMALWDADDLSRPIRKEDVDSSSGILIPFFDPDTSIMYLAGKGDGNIRFYEIVSHPPNIVYLGQFLSNSPQCGLGMMPKWGVDPFKCELVRFYKLHSTKDLCEPISMIAPRKSERFQEDIFPATFSPEPALKAEDWLQGRDSEPKKVSMKDVEETLLTLFPGMYSQSGSGDPTEASNALKGSNWQQEGQLHVSVENHLPTKWRSKEDGRRNSDDEDAECFQRGMVKLNIGKFEHETPPKLQRPPAEETAKGLGTYHFTVSLPNGLSPSPDDIHPPRINEPGMDFADGFSSTTPVRLRQMSLLSSSDQRVPQKGNHSYVILHEEHETKNRGRNGSSDRNHSQQNGTEEPVTMEMWNKQDQSANAAFRSQVRTSGSRIQRSRSELPVSYRYPFWTSKSLAERKTADDEGEHEAGMLDFISTDAPDDTLIKPSVLRSSMLVRRREKDPDEVEECRVLRRTASLKEPRTRSFEMRQVSGESMTGHVSSGFDDGKPVRNAWASSTNRDAADKGSQHILKVEEGRKRTLNILQEEVERKSTSNTFGNSACEHPFHTTPPSFQKATVSGTLTTSGFVLGAHSGTVLTPTAGYIQGNTPDAASGTSANSAYHLTSSSGETISQTVQGTLDRRDSMKFRSASMERWKLHYARLVEGKGGEASSEQIDRGTTHNSTDNIVTTQLVVMLTPQGDRMVSTFNGQKDSAQNQSLSSGAVEDGEGQEAAAENGNRTKIVWNLTEPEKTQALVQRPEWSDETPSNDYQELLSEFVQQRQLIQRLRGDVQTRDRTIQRLEKQLGLLLRQTISLPSLSNYG